MLEIPVPGRVVVTNGAALRTCGLAGMGVLLLPRWHVERHLANGELVELLSEYRCTLSEFDAAGWVVYPSRSYLPRKVRAFVDYLLERYRDGLPGAPASPHPDTMPTRRSRR